jgi:hypothetical protein
MIRYYSTASAVLVTCILTGFSAFAQQATETAAVGAQGNATASTQVGATAQVDPNAAAAATAPAPAIQPAQMGMALPTANAATPPAGASDHDALVGHLAVGFLGRATIPYGAIATLQAPVPVVGVRYWLDPMVGLDLGLGLWLGKTSTDTTPPAGATVTTSGPKPTSFVIHAGVPLALASAKHFVFEITPEANFGYANVTQDAAIDAGITKQSGTHFDIGARAGAEIHFGFMGLPQLSLLGSVGLRFEYDKLTTEVNPVGGAGTTRTSSSTWNLGTTVYDSPWNIFIGNVGALYYF